jgi:hypothetical protein
LTFATQTTQERIHGLHTPTLEAASILGASIDASRKGQVALRDGEARAK